MMVWFVNNLCRVRAPQPGGKVSGLAARQRVKLGKILDQVHSDIVTERETGKLCTKCKAMYTYTSAHIHVCTRSVS